MIHGVHHTAIATPDLQRAVRFYTDLLGFEIVHESRIEPPRAEIDELLELEGVTVAVALLKSGYGFLELFEFRTPPGRPPSARRPLNDAGITHIALRVSDLEAEYARLKAAGMEFHAPPMTSSRLPVRGVYGRDPDGNAIELLEILSSEWPARRAAAPDPGK